MASLKAAWEVVKDLAWLSWQIKIPSTIAVPLMLACLIAGCKM